MGQTASMDRQQPALEEVLEGAVEVLVGVVGLPRDHAAHEVVGAAGKYVSVISSCGDSPLSEHSPGRAFFALLLSFMMPPNMPVQIFLMVGPILIVECAYSEDYCTHSASA